MNVKVRMCYIRDINQVNMDGYKLAYLLIERCSNRKVKISGYQPTFAVAETTRTNHWATGNVNLHSG